MKRETLFLKLVVLLMAVPILALCIFALPSIAREASADYPAYAVYLFVIGVYAAAIPFFFALFQTFKLLSYIDKNKAFSERSVTALKNIKYCAFAVSVLNSGGMPLIYFVAQLDDAPGLILMGMAVIFASVAIGVFAAVLQKLLDNAIEIQSENDLTV